MGDHISGCHTYPRALALERTRHSDGGLMGGQMFQRRWNMDVGMGLEYCTGYQRDSEKSHHAVVCWDGCQRDLGKKIQARRVVVPHCSGTLGQHRTYLVAQTATDEALED